MKGINTQLIAMLLYRGGAVFLGLVSNDKMIEHVVKDILSNENNLSEEYEYQRMILGNYFLKSI